MIILKPQEIRTLLMFNTEEGIPGNAANLLYIRFFPAPRRARLPRMRFYNLGHTYASLLIAQGEHPKYIQSQLGHSSINVKMDIYGHLMEIVNQKAANLLAKIVLGNISMKAQWETMSHQIR
jgi:integrase